MRGLAVIYAQDDSVINNSGTFNFDSGVRFATFDSNVTFNQIDGTLNVDGIVSLDNGSFNVSGGAVQINNQLRVDNNGTIDISGGSIVNDGAFLLDQRGAFNFSGGEVTGTNPVSVFGTTDLTVTHDGSIDFNTSGDTSIFGTLHVGQSLTVSVKNSDLIVQLGFVNNGTITFDNPGSSAQGLRAAAGTSFVNAATGVLRVAPTPLALASTVFFTSIDNAGTIEIEAIVVDIRNNILTNWTAPHCRFEQ